MIVVQEPANGESRVRSGDAIVVNLLSPLINLDLCDAGVIRLSVGYSIGYGHRAYMQLEGEVEK
jgi:hypothetical protein